MTYFSTRLSSLTFRQSLKRLERLTKVYYLSIVYYLRACIPHMFAESLTKSGWNPRCIFPILCYSMQLSTTAVGRTGTNFTNANLEGTNMFGAYAKGAIFRGNHPRAADRAIDPVVIFMAMLPCTAAPALLYCSERGQMPLFGGNTQDPLHFNMTMRLCTCGRRLSGI